MPNHYSVPWGIEKLVIHVMEKYNNTPMYITENGKFLYHKNKIKNSN
jgi:beta-glucosidase/6-phospho-beta-glucosidase/beta-galactosidase